MHVHSFPSNHSKITVQTVLDSILSVVQMLYMYIYHVCNIMYKSKQNTEDYVSCFFISENWSSMQYIALFTGMQIFFCKLIFFQYF